MPYHPSFYGMSVASIFFANLVGGGGCGRNALLPPFLAIRHCQQAGEGLKGVSTHGQANPSKLRTACGQNVHMLHYQASTSELHSISCLRQPTFTCFSSWNWLLPQIWPHVG